MKLHRLEPGRYISVDGKVKITRHVSRQTGYRDEVCWTVTVNNKWVGDEDTFREAKEKAQRKLEVS